MAGSKAAPEVSHEHERSIHSMAHHIPDLWRTNDDARRLYSLYLCRLEMNDRHDRVISACRQIRRYAHRGPGAMEGLFTFYFEIDSLCTLRQYATAWQQLRRQEEIVFGKRIDLISHVWSPQDTPQLLWSYVPLLFFNRWPFLRFTHNRYREESES